MGVEDTFTYLAFVVGLVIGALINHALQAPVDRAQKAERDHHARTDRRGAHSENNCLGKDSRTPSAQVERVRSLLSEAGVTHVPNPYTLRKGALYAFASLAQQDARSVGEVLIPEPRPEDYVRAMAMLGMCAGHLSAARKYAEEGQPDQAWGELDQANDCYGGNVPQWLKDIMVPAPIV